MSSEGEQVSESNVEKNAISTTAANKRPSSSYFHLKMELERIQAVEHTKPSDRGLH